MTHHNVPPSDQVDAIEQAALTEVQRRYQGDTDVLTGDPVDDYGYSACQRQAFIEGAEWAVANLWAAGMLAPSPLREVQAEAWDKGHGAPCDEWWDSRMCRKYHPNPYHAEGDGETRP